MRPSRWVSLCAAAVVCGALAFGAAEEPKPNGARHSGRRLPGLEAQPPPVYTKLKELHLTTSRVRQKTSRIAQEEDPFPART